MEPAAFHGLLVLDKPRGLTSRDVVDRAQRLFPRGTKIGHTGTLDPLATGVLVLCVGATTRLTEYVQRMPKTYRAGIRLGSRSDTDDADGKVTPVADSPAPDRAAVEKSLQGSIGDIEQVPPGFSAAKVSGRRAYALARRGEEVTLAPRRVCIYGIDLLAYDYPRLAIEVRCGKGTYIRSLARDLGERLGCGGLIETLQRTRVGPFTIEQALPVEADPATVRASLLPPMAAVVDLGRVTLGAADLARVRQGNSVRVGEMQPADVDEVAICDERGSLVAVARVARQQGLLRPDKVLGV
jgi:tRNA pseudouridine55 synthase